jgi:DNA-binding response OmpR family regulator
MSSTLSKLEFQRMNEPITLLLVEDESKLARSLERQLERAGFAVDVAPDGYRALEKLDARRYHIIVLDLNLPGMSGFDVLRALRDERRRVPVLILSARQEVIDRVEGLRLGADDYLIKPFDFGEFHARIDAVLRRSGESSFGVLVAEDLVLDLIRRKVHRAGREIHLSPRLFELLEFFLRHRDQILTRRRIAEGVWGYSFDTGTNLVNVYVSNLRKAIDADFEPKLIETVPRQGYVLRVSRTS